MRGLICYDADGTPVDAREADHDVLGPVLVGFEKLSVVDHSAKPGTGSSAAQEIHRIDEAYAKKDFESHGLVFVTSSDALRRPDDPRDANTWKGPMVGKTDRFALVFKKPAQ